MISLFQPQVGDDELKAVSDVFSSRWLGHGPRTEAFEAAFAAHLGVPADRVIFLNSGTAGLFLGLETLNLGPGDEVVLPSTSFVSAANAIMVTGARPVFCDVDPGTQNPGVEDVRRVVTPRTRAVVVLHYGGYPGRVTEIAEYCREEGLTLLEDAACAPASRVGGRAVGTFGDLAIWSFDAMKVIVTGDGGMLYVRDEGRAKRARRLAYHGLERSSGFRYAGVSQRWWELAVPEIGRRLIGNDLTAAIGAVQLERLPRMVARRRDIVERYDRELAGVPGVRRPPALPPGHESSYYFYWVRLDPAVRDAVAQDLLAAGIYTTVRYAPLHRVSTYGAGPVTLPGADRAGRETLCLPLHPGLDDSDVSLIVDRLTTAVAARS
ncbi:DegT/DnrJ/EryC1/StrS family aminotransferase [Frankia sp. AiPs1]|uniref:DegT/DnrJ/EryC1/StrS family aminotransferase n=1 Tax=Frankia sp. AiPs1 TaxID=573493 RepID=UPI00204429A8|nr:DegT/DnrJ/EryC1/StrS family aminotransferase [Frankia sp. AiPs1]MCM3920964.1 DegT/DnrJ/EryC1/StrS family aminotransferase [Frankia sp. AiPs1]